MLIVLQHTTARKLLGALGYAVRQSFLDPQKSGLDFMDSGSEPIGTLSILSLVAGRIQRAANKLNPDCPLAIFRDFEASCER
ncbi:MAG TPA: hypothetical protein PLU47_18570, partial [Azonexus sp.]|nr:hypothetical protein [Azonexus sp.]